ncbi:unnamed protein product, partial [Lymnaea stagnalis]
MAEEAADKDCEMIKVGGIKNMWKIPPCIIYIVTKSEIRGIIYKVTKSEIRGIIYVVTKSEIGGIIYIVTKSEIRGIIYIVTKSEIRGIIYIVTKSAIGGIIYILTKSELRGIIYIVTKSAIGGIIYIVTKSAIGGIIYIVTKSAIGGIIYIVTKSAIGGIIYIVTKSAIGGIIYIVTKSAIGGIIYILGVNVLLNLIKRYIRDRLTTGCDMGRGFVRANELAIRLIDHLSDDANVQHMIRASAEKAKMSVLRELGLLQGLHPDIALGVKTCQAIRSVLNVMRDAMHHLMEEGGIDEAEGLLFIKAMFPYFQVIESKMKRLMAAPPTLEIPSTKKILSAIPWIDGDQSMVEFINNLAEERLYNYGDIILRFGDQPDGIYFIISGLVKVEAFLKTESGVASNNMQTLDFLSTGNVIGEISVLTQKPRTATLTCETSVKTLYLSTADLKEVCEQFRDSTPPLLGRLWKVCAVRISINILANVASYHGMRKETLLARLENAELEHVDEVTNQFEITPQMIDVILIMGEAYDVQTREKFVGPCYIPKTVFSL